MKAINDRRPYEDILLKWIEIDTDEELLRELLEYADNAAQRMKRQNEKYGGFLMNKLQCDICGGQIEMQSGGQNGICVNCGTAYSLDRMKELYSGMKVSITGSKEDVEQWRELLRRYYDSGDFQEAEKIVKKILEAIPSDEDAGDIETIPSFV